LNRQQPNDVKNAEERHTTEQVGVEPVEGTAMSLNDGSRVFDTRIAF
jgi:hypothetical protein